MQDLTLEDVLHELTASQNSPTKIHILTNTLTKQLYRTSPVAIKVYRVSLESGFVELTDTYIPNTRKPFVPKMKEVTHDADLSIVNMHIHEYILVETPKDISPARIRKACLSVIKYLHRDKLASVDSLENQIRNLTRCRNKLKQEDIPLLKDALDRFEGIVADE